MRKTIELGNVDYCGEQCPVIINLELRTIQGNRQTIDLEPVPDSATELSITGEVWKPGRKDLFACGQIYDILAELFPNDARVQRIAEIWQRWHLNSLKAGTRAQLEVLKDCPEQDYNQQCEYLRKQKLYIDRGYKYGTAWLYEPIPTEIIEEIKAL